jgi:hypothetical protein
LDLFGGPIFLFVEALTMLKVLVAFKEAASPEARVVFVRKQLGKHGAKT